MSIYSLSHISVHDFSGMVMRNTPGYAIGGLSGGEEKDQFCDVVGFCTSHLPECKPRYVMGVG